MSKYGKRERYDVAQEQVRLHRWKIFADGTIWSHHKNGPIGTERDGYLRVSVPCGDGKHRYVSAHRVVWEYHNGPSDLDMTINHINGDTLDNSIDNLELVSNQENIIHGHSVLNRGNGSRNRGSLNPRAKFTEEQVREIKKCINNGERGKDIAAKFDTTPQVVSNIKSGYIWGWVE